MQEWDVIAATMYCAAVYVYIGAVVSAITEAEAASSGPWMILLCCQRVRIEFHTITTKRNKKRVNLNIYMLYLYINV